MAGECMCKRRFSGFVHAQPVIKILVRTASSGGLTGRRYLRRETSLECPGQTAKALDYFKIQLNRFWCGQLTSVYQLDCCPGGN